MRQADFPAHEEHCTDTAPMATYDLLMDGLNPTTPTIPITEIQLRTVASYEHEKPPTTTTPKLRHSR